MSPSHKGEATLAWKRSPSKGKRWQECAERGKIARKWWDQDEDCGMHLPQTQWLSSGNGVKRMDSKADNGTSEGGLMVAFLQEWRTAWERGAEMCDWKCNEQVMKGSIMGWLEAGTLILFDTDCKISGEESVKALGNEEKPFGGSEREEWVHR